MTTAIDPHRTVPARLVENLLRDSLDHAAEPGEVQPSTHGLMIACPGCAAFLNLPIEPAPNGWRITAGSLADPPSLTLAPSIWHRGGTPACEWHGYLTAGIFKAL